MFEETRHLGDNLHLTVKEDLTLDIFRFGKKSRDSVQMTHKEFGAICVAFLESKANLNSALVEKAKEGK